MRQGRAAVSPSLTIELPCASRRPSIAKQVRLGGRYDGDDDKVKEKETMNDDCFGSGGGGLRLGGG